MRSLAMTVALALLLAPNASASPPPAGGPASKTASAKPKGALPFPMEVTRLENGLTLIFVPFDSPGLAAYYSLVRTGSRNEVEPGRTGFAHFFEHMMFRGTKAHPKSDYDRKLSMAGFSTNAFTTDDFTAYHSFGPSAKLELVIELEADRFQHLDYSLDDFRTEARAVLGEYNKNFSNPLRKMDEVLSDVAFTTHTYKHTTMGFKEDIEGMPELFDYSREFFRRWYTPDNTTLVVVGQFDQGAVEAAIRKHYSGWSSKAAAIEVPKEPAQRARRAANVRWENPTQPFAIVAWHTPEARIDRPESAIQNLLGAYLFGPTSPLYRDLVLERQLVTSLGPSYYDHRDPNLFSCIAALKEAKEFPQVLKAISASVAELRSGKVDAKRLAAVKSNLKYGLLNSLDNAEAVAQQLVFSIAPTGDPRALDALFAQIEKVGPKELAAFAKKWLVDTNETLITLVGPGDEPPPSVPDYAPQAKAAGGAR